MAGGTQRRLAAIVSIDVVGYSRLMGMDETATLAALRAHRKELIDPKIDEYGGRIVKTMGDGLLLEFPSVVNATQCVIDVQQEMAERNKTVDGNKRITFRVGVNIGDIIIDGEDILGDGVNVTARLQEIAEPGGVAISRRVHEDIRVRLDANFEDVGEQTLKNISLPVHVWRWSPNKQRKESKANAGSGPQSPPGKPSIAVLPFDNMSSDPEHEYFADGIAEDIITALSKISRMRVIARNSTFAYKGRAHDLRQVASELGVRYVLEGSIRSGGNRLRITAQLIDANDGSHVWAERFDRTIDDIFDIQDEITKEVVTALRVNLTDGEEAYILARGTNDIEAWQLCGRAYELFLRFNATDYLEARVLAEKALRLDPDYAYAWATLGLTYWYDGRLGYTGDSEAKFTRAKECAERAMALDAAVSPVIALNVHLAGITGREQEGVAIARRGVELYPGNADVRAFLGFALFRVGAYREAVDHFRAAMSLNPFYPNWYRSSMARILMMLDEFEEAMVLADESLSIEPANIIAWVTKAYMFGQLGRSGDAEEAAKKLTRIAPNLRLEHVPGILMINEATAAQRIIDGLRKVGFPE